jgi:hypothetical protein
LTIVTLLTDFGLRDGNVGVMKGVIWSIAPDAHIADLSHQIRPQNVREAGFTLLRSAFYFPAGSVHIVVVDPGVGTERRPLALQIGEQFFVGPDNGVFTSVMQHGKARDWGIRIVHTNRPEYWRDEVSHVFHGRDIFSPVGAHLAAGALLEKLGDPIDDPVRLPLPRPEQSENGWRGETLHIDHFGNIYTNVRRSHLNGKTDITVEIKGRAITGLIRTFGEREAGELVALYSSTDYLMVSLVNGDAGKKLDAQVGDPVTVSFKQGK